ncbi:RAD5-like protein [Xylariaceae sp. FL0016]|nr:RAD5-like protein [Xylariaceae sp. FL0016]
MGPKKSKRTPVIDLTGDEEQPRKAARMGRGPRSFSGPPGMLAAPSGSQSSSSHQLLHTPSSSYRSSSQDAPRSSWLAEDENEDYFDESPPMEFYGTLDGKIVGVRYYNGIATPGESIICQREPDNQYDRNAVRVDNVMGVQIGHIPRNLAAKLAPYLDNNEIVLEGILNGMKGAFECPIRLYFYGPTDTSTRLELEQKLKEDKLLKATELKRTRQEAEAQRAVHMGLISNAAADGSALSQSQDEEPLILENSELANFRSDITALDALAMDEETLAALPMADQPALVKSKLLPYQLQGLAWMVAKEDPQHPAPGSSDVVQLWKRTQQNNLKNLVSGYVTNGRPALLSGGILADDMGLGKTLQTISLILHGGFRDGPTLVIAPTGVMSNWRDQIRRHVKEEHLNKVEVAVYHRVPGHWAKNDFEKCNIVITSYGKVTSEFTSNPSRGLFSVRWRRIVLDEGHRIRNPATKTAKAACALKARSRWILSGTPIVNNIQDFHSALHFLRITGGIEQKALFNHKIGRPLEAKAKSSKDVHPQDRESRNARVEAEMLFQSLTRDLCLRRKKSMQFIDLKLPPKKEFMHHVTFTDHEKTKYDVLLANARDTFQRYRDRSRKSGPQINYASVLEQLLRLRQMCDHWHLCGSKVNEILKDLDNKSIVDLKNDAHRRILQAALREANNNGEECPVCYEPINMGVPVITKCKHRFCRGCVSQSIQLQKKCPMCRQGLVQKDLMELDPEAEVRASFQDPEAQVERRSAKTDHLETIVKKHLRDPNSKVVIFSQWTSYLDIIEGAFSKSGISSNRLEGCMSPSQRDDAIQALNDDPSMRVMLASLNAASVGVNLVAADTVILSDSWWAPAIEDQAIDRVHRLGQTRPVTVYKMIVDGSVEFRVLDIQAEKRNLVSLAFQEGVNPQMQRSSIRDIERLLEEVPNPPPNPDPQPDLESDSGSTSDSG